MNKELSGKGYIQGGDGHFLTSAGDLYAYHDGELTNQTEPQGVIEMKYLGTFELQPLYDSHQSFHGKALVERYATGEGTKLMLRSYGTVVAVVTPAGMDGEAEAFRVEISMRDLSATTLRHVKEFLAQADDTFKGITLPWIRKAIKDGSRIEGAGSAWRKVYTIDEL